ISTLDAQATGDAAQTTRHGEGVADSPAIRRRSTRHITEVVLRAAGVRRGDDGPRCPVPMLDERPPAADGAGVIVTDSPAIRRRSARHPTEFVALRSVGRGDDGPRCPVPMLDERPVEGML